jgi:VIT1/CCC1 family predicted Fe2+/Mn2+ transporter
MDERIRRLAIRAQATETTETVIYERLAARCRDEKNAAVLRRIGVAERRHAAFWARKTGVEVTPNRLKISWSLFLARILGLTFVLKRMENNEGTASHDYEALSSLVPEARKIGRDEAAHEQSLLAMLDEERLRYVGSIVLGLNDALVELTGALAGFTLALADTRIISLAGLITGISAAFSMAASDYLSSKAEQDPRAATSAIYTGVTYLGTVILLILPFLLIPSRFAALAITLAVVVLIILLFTYYLAVAKDLDFKKRFLEMAGISLGVAAFSFLIGYLLKILLGVET